MIVLTVTVEEDAGGAGVFVGHFVGCSKLVSW
jgi:hypothetical protein